jgi:tetratricopeptide (TPR) repeat protein
MKTFAAVAALGAVVLTGTVQKAAAQSAGGQPTAQPEKKVKDQGESDIWNQAIKDMAAKDYNKAVADLDTWKQKYPESDFKDVRNLLFVQAYQNSGQFGKALDAAGELLSKNLDTVFNDPKTGAQSAVQLLYAATASVQQAFAKNENLTPEELATGQKAAKLLYDFNRAPAGMEGKAWDDARKQLQAAARATLMAIALRPGDQAMANKDCATAASVYEKALDDHPDQSFISYKLGSAWACVARATPDKTAEIAPKAIYEFLRAAVLDPSLGGSQPDPAKTTKYADDFYKNFHGSDEGLAQLKDQVKASPLPPAGFSIESAQAIAVRKQNEFKEKYPEVALWLGIKSQLADPSTGTQYFEGQLKDTEVPELKGTVVEGKPACRSKEILVAVPMPDQAAGTTATPEITLKLDAPLTGKPEPGEIRFKGVPSAFTQNPSLMLTMTAEKANIKGLNVSACSVAPARGGKKSSSKKK